MDRKREREKTDKMGSKRERNEKKSKDNIGKRAKRGSC
uniref:Uncharacterized protein n=1 Tax=Anguilla anguilla TaxID=7936 RepID=A0A0E9RKW6_ANGAN